MRETPDAGRRRIDLSVPQVAGSALAAVVAAKLASYFGVYGTILGAGIVSIVATCGGSLFQHFFRRTGEQIREATVTARPAERAPSAPDGFTEGTVYRARVKSWKRPVLAASLVFGVTMAGITAYELVSGGSFSGGGGTTVGDAVTGRGPSPSKPGDTTPSWSPSDLPASGATPSGDSATTHSATPTPSDSPGREPGGDAATPTPPPTPTPTPGESSATPTPPEPSASSRSGTAVPGQGGPAER
ncbi:hypothetical protein J2Z21_001354 [Streptomyces griseochromogenes]|uniref:Uncharacterized protein n=1 Tax=Streptomyces griseochromogenes TaxID=68214 RepID=A0ABS4LM19_9ACTN|nr:hypothetical protein [Streptomyces griseochromogenes]MBP2048430.1 hypothetical protein [Streptomyces griseochromogenes]